MFESEYWRQIYSNLDGMPSSRANFFREVWNKGRLHFEGGENSIDKIDRHSAQLICAAQSQQKPLLIVLPDEAPHRIPLLFATTLLKQALDNISSEVWYSTAIYFGAAAGIRNHLSQTYCGNYCLKDLFNQTDLKGSINTDLPEHNLQNSLPHVIFSNMPTNPDQIIDKYRPDWCFVDLGNGERLKWFSSCLTTLQQTNIPVIACIQNPLSDAIQQCEQAGWQVFRWPYSVFGKTRDECVSVQPLVLEGKTVESHSEKYQEVYQNLYKLSKKAKGKFKSDAIRIVRQYATSLEQLNTPYKFYEVESQRLWGIYSLLDSQQTAQRFVENLQNDNSPLDTPLHTICETLNQIHQQLQSMEEPPLWRTLSNLCVPELEENSVRILVFPSEARKTLFALALLAYHNLSADDLVSINVWLVSLKRFSQWQRTREYYQGQEEIYNGNMPPIEKLWQPLLVGIPRHDARYAPLLRCGKLDVLLYQHQANAFQYGINQWNRAVHGESPANLQTLSALTPDTQILPSTPNDNRPSQRVVITTPQKWRVEENEEIVVPEIQELFRAPARVDEISWLMQPDDSISSDEQVLLDETSSKTEITVHHTMTTDRIIHVTFQEGVHVQFSQDATVQLVLETNTGRQLDERNVRSLRVNDVVLFIHGQNRQNLYELIVSRVHGHPSIALFVTLIQRWHEEIAESIRKSNLAPEEILNRMRQRGSQLQTPQTIRLWLDGQVLCPHEPADLQRIADVLNLSFAQQYHREIARAATRLRGIHIGLSRKLNQWLEQETIGATSEQINEFIDPELGITFNDFQDALYLLTVKETKQVEGLFLTSELGQLSEGTSYV